MKIKYTRVKTCKNLSAEESAVVAAELRKIQRKHSVITPVVVVEQAEHPSSPLHRYFEWNDGTAAQRYREWQARFLIASVYVINADDPDSEPIRAFVNVSPDDEEADFVGDRGYVFTSSIKGKRGYENQVLEYAKQQLIGWKKRFGTYREFFGVVQEIEKLK